MDLDALLGIDPTDPIDALAGRLVRADGAMLDSLIALRKEKEMSQAAVGEAMGGISQSAVARIESGERDPRLSTLRRYALAIGADVQHEVRRYQHTRPAARRAEIEDILSGEFALPDGLDTRDLVERSRTAARTRTRS